MESESHVQILNKAAFASLRTNAVSKGINQSFLLL